MSTFKDTGKAATRIVWQVRNYSNDDQYWFSEKPVLCGSCHWTSAGPFNSLLGQAPVKLTGLEAESKPMKIRVTVEILNEITE